MTKVDHEKADYEASPEDYEASPDYDAKRLTTTKVTDYDARTT